jgi:hypothetical protein
VYFSSALLADAPGALARRLQALSAAEPASALFVLSATFMRLTIFLSAIALFACVQAWSVIWGRILPYGAGIVGIYAFVFSYRVRSGSAQLEDIQQHMWGFALAVLVLTLLALGRTLYLKILSLRAGLATLACWALFVACAIYSLAQQDIVLVNQASELQALNAALLLLPFTLLVLLFWSYDRLRHR